MHKTWKIERNKSIYCCVTVDSHLESQPTVLQFSLIFLGSAQTSVEEYENTFSSDKLWTDILHSSA